MSLSLYNTGDEFKQEENQLVTNNDLYQPVSESTTYMDVLAPQPANIIPHSISLPPMVQPVYQQNQHDQQFRIIDGQPYINCQFLVKHVNLAVELSQKKIQNTTQSDQLILQRQQYQQDRTKMHYMWTFENHRKFAIAALAFGIKTVTPKQLLSVLDDESLNREKIASHLQKFRLQIAKQYNKEVKQIINTDIPTNIGHEFINYIYDRWSEPNSTGFSIDEIKRMLNALK